MTPDERRAHGEQAFRCGIESFSLEANVGKLEEVLVAATGSA